MSKTRISLLTSCKLWVTILLVVLLSACVYEPPKEPPLSQWSTEQLVTKGRAEFEMANYSNAAKYLREAANRDEPEALYALGYMYYYGQGVARDVNMAQDLIRRSAAFGHKPAIKALRLFIANKSTFTVDTAQSSYLNDSAPAVRQTDSTKVTKTDSKKNILSTKPEIADTENNLAKHTIISTPDFQEQDNRAAFTTAAIESEQSNPIVATNDDNEESEIIQTPLINSTHKLVKLNQEEFQPISKNDSDKKNIVQNQTQIALEQNHLKATELNNLWLRKQNPNSYTVQITAKKNLPELEQFIDANNLNTRAKIFSYLYKNEIWYGAGIGIYEKPSQAYQAMLHDIPRGLKTAKPWVRQFKNIQDVSNS